ncbi:MAG: hypothetical protein K2N38_01985 [Oscillospiraceae bacterium]|nr:hypothetical protein [Oscillospiraceae bacterium]
MNRNFKAIGAAILAAVMCSSFAGCSKKEDNGVYVDKDGNVYVNESKFEDHINSVFGGGDTNNSTSSTAGETSEPEEFKLVVSDEIKNADLSSGKIQINNDIFQLGAYVTVAEFVEMYKDNYDITYKGGTYEEHKDYLLKYQNYDDGSTSYTLTMMPKLKNASIITVNIDNVTSPDEKITLDKAVVIGFNGFRYHSTDNTAVFPGGFMSNKLISNGKKEEDFVNANEDFNIKTIPEYLEGAGFKLCEADIWSTPKITSANDKLYWTENNQWYAKCCGEKGLNGKIPVYKYNFVFNSDTDKLSYVGIDYWYTTFE